MEANKHLFLNTHTSSIKIIVYIALGSRIQSGLSQESRIQTAWEAKIFPRPNTNHKERTPSSNTQTLTTKRELCVKQSSGNHGVPMQF